MKHPICDVICAWANGEVVQYRGETTWIDWGIGGLLAPSHQYFAEWRIKPTPKMLRFRVALVRVTSGAAIDCGITYTDWDGEGASIYGERFISWIGGDAEGWQEVELPE